MAGPWPGSLGLSEEVLKRADYKLSFSEMTFWLATVAKATSIAEISALNYSWWALEIVTITADQDLLAGALQHTYWDAPSDSYDLVFWHRDFDIILRKVKAEQKPDEYYWDNPAHVATAVADAALSNIEIKGR